MYIDGYDGSKLLQKADDFFGNPFFLFDASFRLFSTSWKNKMAGKYLKEYNNTHILTDDILNELKSNGDLDTIKNSNEVVIKNYSKIKNKVMFKRIFDSRYTYGYMCLYAKNKEFGKEDEQLLDLICRISLHSLKNNGMEYSTDSIVFNQIIDGVLENKEEINRILINLNLNKKENKRVVLIKTNMMQQLSIYLSNKVKDIELFKHNGDIVCFTSDEREKIDNIISDLIQEMKDDSIQIGISEIFDDYADLAIFYKQALESIEIGNKFIKEGNVHYSEDYKTLALLNRLSDKELQDIIDDRVNQIITYDKENKTSYLHDIEVYFASGRNINRASKMLFVHKNSMYYRMDKIKELFGLDLKNENDCFSIELSLKILRLSQK